MSNDLGGAGSAVRTPEDQLSSWKEIAAHFARDITTVQRWEKREGMPVYRHLHDKMGSVYAFVSELEAWARSRNSKVVLDSTNGNQLPDLIATPPQIETQEQAKSRTEKKRWSLGSTTFLLAVVGVALAISATWWLRKGDLFWHNPLEGARFEVITDFDGVTKDAALSRDGHLVAFLSDHDGPMDVWVGQVGSGQFHNLTHGAMKGFELVNPSVRTLGFSADSSVITFWTRKGAGANGAGISIWSIPTLGGQPQVYLEGVAEFDWSHDGARLAYHNPGPGDPLFISDGLNKSEAGPLFTAQPGLHSHFPLWSTDGTFIYFVQGAIPNKSDLWRIHSSGGTAERMTSSSDYVSYPVAITDHRLVYLAKNPDSSGSRLYSIDVTDRVSHQLTTGPERYTSLAASADGRRLAVTLANPKTTLWRLDMGDGASDISNPIPVPLTTKAGFFPRYGPDYLLYVSRTGEGDSVWKFAQQISTELWKVKGSRVLAAPVVSRDGTSIAVSAQQDGKTKLFVMQADGTRAHLVTDALDLQGAPAWAPDGRSLFSSASYRGVARIFRIPLDGGPPVIFVKEYSIDPVWAPDGRVLIYSGPDIGTTFSIKAVNADGSPRPLPAITLTRGARHPVFGLGGHSLFLERGEIEHKDVWSIDLGTGAERRFTHLAAGFNIRDFDLSSDQRELVFERVQERSEIVLVDLPLH